MVDIWNDFLVGNQTLNTIIILVLIIAISIVLAKLVNALSATSFLGIFAVVVIYLFAYGVLNETWGAIGFIVMSIVITILILMIRRNKE